MAMLLPWLPGRAEDTRKTMKRQAREEDEA